MEGDNLVSSEIPVTKAVEDTEIVADAVKVFAYLYILQFLSVLSIEYRLTESNSVTVLHS